MSMMPWPWRISSSAGLLRYCIEPKIGFCQKTIIARSSSCVR